MEQHEHREHKRFNPENRARLDNPERRRAMPPEPLLDWLTLAGDQTVVDLGAGTGYFTLPAAQRTTGTVYALDAEPDMLAVIAEKLEQAPHANIQLVQGEIEQVPLPDAVADRAIASLVLHEVEPLTAGLSELWRLLKPGGRALVIEWKKQPTENGPPLHHRIAAADLVAACAAAGLQVCHEMEPTPNHYALLL
ncbi:MAG: class I SAM-dependent methyltransferase, partial [Alicyclobacillus sp.]|nr:class I SAM-dependent methyltransferase [Alicyclobacillus sp.]